MLSITNHQENVNQNYNEIFPHLLGLLLSKKKKKKITNIGKHVEKLVCLYTVGGNVNWCSHYGKQ